MNHEATPPSEEQTAELRQVLTQCEAGLRAMLRHRLRDAASIDDCVQTVALKWLQYGGAVAPAARRAWLFRVAANEAALLWRRESAGRTALQRAAELQGVNHHVRPPHDRHETETPRSNQPPLGFLESCDLQTPTGESLLLRREAMAAIRMAMEELPEEQSLILRLRFEHDLTFAQISERLGIPLGTTLTRARRALAKLRANEKLISLLEP